MVSADFAGVLNQLDEMVEAYTVMAQLMSDRGYGFKNDECREEARRVYLLCLEDAEMARELLQLGLQN